MNTNDILDNIDAYSAEQLASFINQGRVTLDDLKETGDLPAAKRRAIEDCLKNGDRDAWAAASSSDTQTGYLNYLSAFPQGVYVDAAKTALDKLKDKESQALVETLWLNVDKNDAGALNNFMASYPDSPHCSQARKLLNDIRLRVLQGSGIAALKEKIDAILVNKSFNTVLSIEDALSKGFVSKQNIIDELRSDPNFLKAAVVKTLVSNGSLSVNDVANAGFGDEYLKKMLADERTIDFAAPSKPLEKVSRVCTEIYFWGIPSSGKTCALGAILSAANDGNTVSTMAKDNNCQGYGYMNSLSQLFEKGRVKVLPGGTPTDATYELSFDLIDQKDKHHPITCIDLAGELLRIMADKDGDTTLNVDEEKVLDTVTKVLISNRSTNRKMHFFVIEYGGENRLYKGYTQKTLLDVALRYIERTKIFEKETDAIYLLVTKVDKVKGNDLKTALQEYIDINYKAFYNGLSNICRDHEINHGEVKRIPFSLGEVCMQDYCRFDDKYAAYAVKQILEKVPGTGTGWMSKIGSIFRS